MNARLKAKKFRKRWLRFVRNNIRRARGDHQRWDRTVEHGWTYSTSYIDMAHPEILSPRSWRRRLAATRQTGGDT